MFPKGKATLLTMLVMLMLLYAGAKAQDYSYCIVVHDSLVDILEPLAEWKAEKGLSVFLARISWIEEQYQGRDRAEKIRNFVAHSDSVWPSLEYLLLAGDCATIPPRYVKTYYPLMTDDTIEVPCDDYYANLKTNWDLDGDGIFGEDSTQCSLGKDEIDFNYDLCVGRLPSDKRDDMINMVDKIITYERNPPGGDWPSRMIFCAPIFNTQDSTDCIDSKEDVYSSHFPQPNDFKITRLYESMVQDFDSLTVDRFLDAFNQGASIVNSISHGSETELMWCEKVDGNWSMGDNLSDKVAETVTNGYKLPMFVACACYTACFDYWFDCRKCLGEVFMTVPEGGTIVYLGSSRLDFGQEYYFYESFFGESDRRPGKAFRISKLNLLGNYTPEEDPVWRHHNLAPTMFGDPELRIWIEEIEGIEEIAGQPKPQMEIASYPNPFTSRTVISFSLAQNGFVDLKVYDCAGKLMRTLAGEDRLSGTHTIQWNRQDDSGLRVPAGIYFLELRSQSVRNTYKLVVAN